MLSELIKLWFAVLWGISAACVWTLKATAKATAWLLMIPVRFWRGYRQTADE